MLSNAPSLKPEKSSLVRSLLPLAVAALLIVAMIQWVQREPAFLRASRNALFRMEHGTWQRLPELPGDPEKLQVSAGGELWALLWHYGVGSELARFNGPSWLIYRSADFGTRGVDASAGFVLDGEDVWAATDQGVLHWDGRHWTCYRQATGSASSIVAANGKVWAIDDKRNLSHFDGRRWQVQKVELPGARWADNSDGDVPQLALTPDGSLWIVRNGVWRSHGSAWTAVQPEGRDFKDASLVGATSQAIWLWDGEHLDSVGLDGALREFGPREMGFSQLGINEVAATADRTYAATSRGVLEFDGVRWRPLVPPRDGVRAVIGIRAGAGGTLFAIGNIPNPVAQRWRFLKQVVPLLLLMGLVVVLVWMVRGYKRRQWTEHLRLQQAVTHATGAVPEEFARDERLLAKQASWWSATLTVGVIVGAMAGYWIVRLFWAAVPSWMFLAIALALHLLVTLTQSLVKRTPKPWDPIEPGGPSFDWGPTRRALPASLAVFFLMNLADSPKWMGNPASWVLYGFLALLWYKLIEQKLLVSAINRGDYERGLKVVGWFHFYNPEGGPALMRRGHILLLAGRFSEAEETLRRAVAGLRSRPLQAHALEFLGDTLMERGSYGDAMRSYEAALHSAPGFRRPYRGMAELTLREGRDRTLALDYVEQILGASGPSWNRWTINGQATDDYWSLKAWALAEMGRGAEVAPAVAEAVRHTNPKSRPDLATTYRRLGLAMQAMDRHAEADAYLTKARDADPHGRWVTLIDTALGRKSVWRV